MTAPSRKGGRPQLNVCIITCAVSLVLFGSTLTFYVHRKQSMAQEAAHSHEDIDFLLEYLPAPVDSAKSQHGLTRRTGFKISSTSVEEEFSSYLLKKQEFKISTYIMALSNAVKILRLPPTPTLLDAINDCNTNWKPPLFHNQHALELRFPSMLSQMSLLSEKYHGKQGTSYFAIQHTENRNLSHYPPIHQDHAFGEPLFYYMQSFVYYTVYCSYKARGKENWLKGGRYRQEIADYVIATPEWQRNQGIDFISPASHPKAGPGVLHPASMNTFSRQTFLRTDFDISGYSPKDVIVPYFVEYTHSRQTYKDSSVRHPHEGCAAEQPGQRLALRGNHTVSAARPEREQAVEERSRVKDILVMFVANDYPKDGLRRQLERRFQAAIEAHQYSDIVFATQPTCSYSYKSLLFNAEFCLSIRGDTASSSRLFTAIEAGCIPVIISNWIQLPFQSLIDYSQFSLVFPESILSDVDYLIDFLRRVPPERRAKMRWALLDVRPMLLYQPSPVNYSLLNPVTLSLVETLINRKRYCDELTSPESSPMCKQLLKRLRVAQQHTLSKVDEGARWSTPT